MGRPIKTAKTGNTGAAVNTALPIGTSGLSGNQMIFKAFVTSGSVNDAGGTYFASQITGRHFVVGALGTGSQFAVGDKALLVASGPVENVSLSIPNG